MAHYPADTFQEATEIAIEASNQLHGVINGDANVEVTVEDGSKIPSVRKAMVDSLYFKPPIAWAQGEYEDTYNQLREFVDGDVRTWWFAKSATVSTPVLMTTNPATDPNWTLWSAVTLNAATYETQKRLAAEAGLNMVGSFLLGGTVTNVGDVVFCETDGKYYGWAGTFPKFVAAGATPETSGGIGAGAWVDRTDVSIRSELTANDGASLIGSMSYAQLRAYSGVNTTVKVWGISNAFDGANGTFKLNASDTTSPDNGGTILVDAIGRRWYRVYSGAVNVAWFGAKGDGTTDDSVAIQQAINVASMVNASPGRTYLIKTPLKVTKSNLELDFSYSAIQLDDSTGTLSNLILGDGITQYHNIKVHRSTFSRKQAATSGYCIDTNYIGVCEISNNRIYGNNLFYNGIRVYRSIILNVFNNYIDNCKNLGIYLAGADSTTNRTIDTSIFNNRIEGGVTAISAYDFVEGLYIRENILYNTSSSALAISASSTSNGLASFKIQENDFDTCSGVYINNVSNIQIDENWFSSTTWISLDVGAGTDSCIITNNQIYQTVGGIRVAGTAALVESNLISGGQSAVTVRSTAVNTSVISNTLAYGTHGVDLSEGPSTVSVLSNNIYGQSSTPIVGETFGSKVIVDNNTGDSARAVSNPIIVTSSPMTYKAGPRPEVVSIFGGTVSQIAIGANNVGFTSNRTVQLAPNQSLTVTYSSAPFMTKNIL